MSEAATPPVFQLDAPAKVESKVDDTLLRAATKFRVALRDCPAWETPADSPEHAVKLFMERNGIIETRNKFEVSPVD